MQSGVGSSVHRKGGVVRLPLRMLDVFDRIRGFASEGSIFSRDSTWRFRILVSASEIVDYDSDNYDNEKGNDDLYDDY